MKSIQWTVLYVTMAFLVFTGLGCPRDDDDDKEIDTGSSDTDIDADSDSDSDVGDDTDTGPDDNCPDCLGEMCTGGTVCCDEAICSYAIYDDPAFTAHYCYPGCDAIDSCECGGDICVQLTEKEAACLGSGSSTADGIEIKILAEMYYSEMLDNDTLLEQEIGTANVRVRTELDGLNVPTEIGFGSIIEMDLNDDGSDESYIRLEILGSAGLSDMWAMVVLIPEERFVVGTLGSSTYTDGDEIKLNFDAWMNLFKYSSTGRELLGESIEALVLDSSTITINRIAEYCTVSPCPKSDISFDLQFAAIRAGLPLD